MGKEKFRTILRFIGLTDDVTAIPRLIILGGGAVTVALGHIFEAIRNLSLGYQILFGLGVLLLWLAGVLSVVGWLRRRKPPVLEASTRTTAWLERLAEQDIDNLSQRIKVEVRQIDFNGLNANVPHLKLFIRLVNASIFKVKLLRCDGYIQLSSEQCSPPQLDKYPELEHGTSAKVTLHQSLDKTTAQWLMKVVKTDNKVNIVCIMCQLVFQVISEGYNKQVEITLNDGGLNCTPEGVQIIFNGNIGRVTS